MRKYLLVALVFTHYLINAQIIYTVDSTGCGNVNGMVFDHNGNLYFADVLGSQIKKMDTNYITSIVAGTGTSGFSGDNGPATNAELNAPNGITVDTLGNIFFADNHNNRIRKIDIATGIITTIAGTGSGGFSGDEGPAINATLHYPGGICFDGLGNLYISDFFNYRIRKVNTSGIISTYAGNGLPGSIGDGGPATSAKCYPADIKIDPSGNLYITQGITYPTVRKVNSSGIISTFAGDTISHVYNGDGIPATSAYLDPTWAAIGKNGLLYVSDGNGRIRFIDGFEIIHTIAGNSTIGHTGDGGPATAAEIEPSGLAFNNCGNFISVALL